mgnify:CR=1 FL=1
MSKPEWGEKRICPKCSMKYYDFNKSPIVCPCPEAFEFDPDLLLKSRKGRGFTAKIDESENKETVNTEEISKDDIEGLETEDSQILPLEENDDDEELSANLDKDMSKDIDENEGNEILSSTNDIDFDDESLDDDTSVSLEVEEDEDKK